jgi:hypothetical protein
MELNLHSPICIQAMRRNNFTYTLSLTSPYFDVLNNLVLGMCKILGPKYGEIGLFVVKIRTVYMCVRLECSAFIETFN